MNFFGPPREQKPPWTPPKWAIPAILLLGIVWGYIEIRYAGSYFFGGAAIFLAALASYELYKYKPKSAEDTQGNEENEIPAED